MVTEMLSKERSLGNKSNIKLSTHTMGLILILVLSFVLRFMFAYIIPFDGAPDEYSHFTLVSFFVHNFRFPTRTEVFHLNIAGPYSAMSPVPYAIQWLFALISLQTKPFLLPRIGSVVVGTGVVWVSALAANGFLPKEDWRTLAFPLIFAVHPQLVFLSAYVNADIFSIFVCSLMMLVWAKLLREGITLVNSVYLGLASSLLLLVKLNSLALFPPTAFIVLLVAMRKRLPMSDLLKYFLILTGIVCLLTSWFFLHNALTLNGDITGYKTLYQVAITKMHKAVSPSDQGMTFITMITGTPWLSLTFKSSWAVFGYMTYFLPGLFYKIMGIFSLIAVYSLISNLITNPKRLFIPKALIMAYAMTFLSAFALMLWTSYFNDWQPQGRYHFPAMLGEMFIIFQGLVLVRKYEIFQKLIIGLFVGSLIAADLWGVYLLFPC